MKRFIILLLCLALPISGLAGPTEHPELPGAVRKLCHDRYPGYEISSATGFGDDGAGQYALVLSKEDQRQLLIIEKGREEPAYSITVDNAKAIKPGSQASALIGTAGDSLFLSFRDGEQMWSFHATKQDGFWGKVDLTFWDLSYHCSIPSWYFYEKDGLLYSTEEWSDGNDNTQSLTPYPPFPVPHLAAKMRLSDCDWSLFPTTARDYFLTGGEALQATVKAMQPEGWKHVQAGITPQGIFLLGEDALGERRIHIHNWIPDLEKATLSPSGPTVSAPIPGHVSMDAYHMSRSLILNLDGESFSCSFRRGLDGKWRLSGVMGEDEFIVGQDHYQSHKEPEWRKLIYGNHPDWVLETVDLRSVPRSLDAAMALLDQSAWAVVNNPDPADRLHLRAGSNKQAESLGKYYNGAPVRVLQRQGEWAHVDVRGVKGYMLSRFLVFGKAMNGVQPAFPPLVLKDDAPRWMYSQPSLQAPKLRESLALDPSRPLFVLGVVGEGWFHVFQPSSGIAGYMLQSWFWEGNG